MKINRRQFVQTSTAAGAGLVVAFRFPEVLSNTEPSVFGPNAYIRISSDNVVTLSITRSEMGQGVRTNLPATLAEELEVELSKVKLDQAMPGARFKGIRLRTSGSGSSSGTFMALRRAGATAREMLISAAAQRWNVDRSLCRAELGFVTDNSGRKLSYGSLAEAAAKLPVPENPPLKDPKNFRLLGKPLKRIDGPAIVRGQAIYGFDVRVPGLLFAVMERCPFLGGKVASFDARKAMAVAGVRHVAPIQTGISTGVAVVADNTWAAMKGREALEVKWDKGPNSEFDSAQFLTKLKTAFSEEGFPIRREGDTAAAFKNAASRIDAVYEYPFQAHAPIETMNCTADVRSNSCEVWAPTQTPDTAHADIMKTLKLPSESVKFHTTMSGGGFGRRLFSDYVDEAVELSNAIGKPVQLIWTRTDDMRNGFFHPASVEQLSAGFDAGKRPIAWLHKSAGSDLSMFGPPTQEEKKNVNRYANDGSPWGAYDNPYNFSSMKVDYVPVASPVPTGPWRAVEYPARVFARESFVDEIAHVSGLDPLQFRINLLQPGGILTLGPQKIDRTRMIRVLEFLREKSGWTRPLAAADGRLWGRGLAVNVYDAESYVAQVAEVSVARDFSDFRLHRICCAVDCGFVINPAGLEGQVESGITWGLSATLHGKIDFRGGRAQQGTYEDFRVMRMNEMPNIETYLIPSTGRPSGFGEHPVPPVAPAVANALFAATGKRLRSLPITAERLRNGPVSK